MIKKTTIVGNVLETLTDLSFYCFNGSPYPTLREHSLHWLPLNSNPVYKIIAHYRQGVSAHLRLQKEAFEVAVLGKNSFRHSDCCSPQISVRESTNTFTFYRNKTVRKKRPPFATLQGKPTCCHISTVCL